MLEWELKINLLFDPSTLTPRLNDYLEPKVEEKDITELSLDFQATLSAQHTEQTIIDPGNKKRGWKCFLMD